MSRNSRNRSLGTLNPVDRVRTSDEATLFWPANGQLRTNGQMELVPAGHFSLDELVDAYNQTRVDYIVPMPMNVARLNAYIKLYDISLAASWVALCGDTIYGLGMLGLREDRAWITRVGVLPNGRRRGTGRALINRLLQSAAERGIDTVWLEVIEGNEPAHQLFLTSGFQPTRKLVVARRPPDLDAFEHHDSPVRRNSLHLTNLDRDGALALLDQRCRRPNWLNEVESFDNVHDLRALYVERDDGGRGWVCYQPDALQLKYIVLETVEGDPAGMTTSVLQALHECYATQDAVMENLPATDPAWLGFQNIGYFDVFRRIEMVKHGLCL